jgi:hypothetical protein
MERIHVPHIVKQFNNYTGRFRTDTSEMSIELIGNGK